MGEDEINDEDENDSPNLLSLMIAERDFLKLVHPLERINELIDCRREPHIGNNLGRGCNKVHQYKAKIN